MYALHCAVLSCALVVGVCHELVCLEIELGVVSVGHRLNCTMR